MQAIGIVGANGVLWLVGLGGNNNKPKTKALCINSNNGTNPPLAKNFDNAKR